MKKLLSNRATSAASTTMPARMERGFALVVAVSMLVLLSLLAVALLSLSSLATSNTSINKAQEQARANARMALMMAIGTLQSEMGPDMRVSAPSAILDTAEDTPTIDGVRQSQWLGAYDAWGNWLNDSYTPPGKTSISSIRNTYSKGRENMFRRWLLSLPPGDESSLAAPLDVIPSDDWVTMVGEGTLGESTARLNPNLVTQAYRIPVGENGRYAWWIGAENQKAKATLAKADRDLSITQWENSAGNTGEVGVGVLQGLAPLDNNADTSSKLMSQATIQLGVNQSDIPDVREKFFDLTTDSKGVLASVRTGLLKKDLSLLFEKPSSALPDPYRFVSGDIQEPSIRPMSPELLAVTRTDGGSGSYFPMRHFQSWTNMRHYYRMYRQTSDANTGGSNSTGGAGCLRWQGTKPWTQIATMKDCDNTSWTGQDQYWRYPVVAKFTYIFSLMALPSTFAGRYELYVVYTPVVTYWNPYNVELRISDRTLGSFTGAPRAWPVAAQFFTRNSGTGQHVLHSINNNVGGINYLIGGPTGRNNVVTWLSSGDGSDIVFKPGQFRVFSLKNYTSATTWQHYNLVPGFDPLGIAGGDMLRIPGIYYINDQPAMALRFGMNGWVFNINTGNTPGSLTYCQMWGTNGTTEGNPPMLYMHDWFRADAATQPRTESEGFTRISLDPVVVSSAATRPENLERWVFDGAPHPFAYSQMVVKTSSPFEYESINWARKDWRSRNWIQSPSYYQGGATYISDNRAIADTQRWDCPYSINFGPLSSLGEAVALVNPFTDASVAKLGSGASPVEHVSELSTLELPTAPISSLAGFSGMRINPGWVNPQSIVDQSNIPKLRLRRLAGTSTSVAEGSAWYAEGKIHAYQSGVTGPGIGNSFMHPILSRDGIYKDFSNSTSLDPRVRTVPDNYQTNDLKLFRDHWDHVFLLNDALWDDYFLSSLADQTRPGASPANSVQDNLNLLFNGELINSRYRYHSGGMSDNDVSAELTAADAYLKAAAHLMVDGMFNVNSTSVDAWHALFAGIRERRAVYRDNNGNLNEIPIPADKRIALTRFNTEVSGSEMDSPEAGVTMPSGWPGWSGVRFLDDAQLRRLAEECVKQVKLRGPFLNFSEFINRRLSDDELGTMGALQAAIDYDDDNPDPDSINYMFKSDPGYMIEAADLNGLLVGSVDAATGSRFAGVPGYVIQSDLLKPLGNVLAVRDDTFRIRAYGEALNADGTVAARAWCEAVVQRMPEYVDPQNSPEIPARVLDDNGVFGDNPALTTANRRFGRAMEIISFRWLNSAEI